MKPGHLIPSPVLFSPCHSCLFHLKCSDRLQRKRCLRASWKLYKTVISNFELSWPGYSIPFCCSPAVILGYISGELSRGLQVNCCRVIEHLFRVRYCASHWGTEQGEQLCFHRSYTPSPLVTSSWRASNVYRSL